MDSGSDNESIEGDVTLKTSASGWGKAKHDYYYTDYIDKDYPSKLTNKEEKLAAIEQEEALRIQKKLLSTLDNVNLETVFDKDIDQDDELDLIDLLESQNRSLDSRTNQTASKKRKKVSFEKNVNNEEDDDNVNSDSFDDDDEVDDESEDGAKQVTIKDDPNSRRRPINLAMKKNRGLTPYKKKEYRNPRVKHKNKYKKAMSKRRRNVKEVKVEYHRYSGEANGIKTSTVKSIRLC